MGVNLWADPANAYPNDVRFFTTFLRAGDAVVDVGANIGLLTLTAAQAVGHHGHVFSVEPHPQTFSYLCENVALNGFAHVDCFQCVLGAERGAVYLSEGLSDDERAVQLDNSGVQVPARTLDEIVPAGTNLTLLKVDVEGYEQFVFEGGRQTLERTACVYFEGFDELAARFGSSVNDTIGLLTSLGFSVHRFENGSLVRAAKLDRQRRELMNYVAVRDVAILRERFDHGEAAAREPR
jgi:FkbM family methyltransferase